MKLILSRRGPQRIPGVLAAAWLVCAAGAAGAQDSTSIHFETELLEMSLSGGPYPLPLGPNWDPVDSRIDITLSSQRAVPGPPSLGQACAFQQFGRVVCQPPLDPVDPAALDGKEFFVDSFFDVFFDIELTDVDPGQNYAGHPDGASMVFPDNGPAHLQSFTERSRPVFDKDAPNYGLIPPPENAPYIGHFQVEIPLGADLNGNGEPDKIKFTLVTHSVGDSNRTFIVLPGGQWLDEFDSGAFLEGAVVDSSEDPPFVVGRRRPDGLPDPSAFGGRTKASSLIRNRIAVGVPGDRPNVLEGAIGYPNPFQFDTGIRFSLAAAAPVRIAVYDVAGRLVRELYSGHMRQGPHYIRWDGMDASGNRVGSGTYLVRVRTGDETIQTKLVSIK